MTLTYLEGSPLGIGHLDEVVVKSKLVLKLSE